MAKWLILFTKGRGEKETFGGRERLKKIILVVLFGGGRDTSRFLSPKARNPSGPH